MYLSAMYAIPFVTVATLNGFIWREVRRATRDLVQMNPQQVQELRLSICAVAIFLCCNTPAMVSIVLELMDVHLRALVAVSNLLITFKSSVNFVINISFGGHFRRWFLPAFLDAPPDHPAIGLHAHPDH